MNAVHTLDAEAVTYIPAQGFFVSPTGEVTVELFSDDIAEAININLEGSLSHLRWGNIQEMGTDIVIALEADTAQVRSYNVAKKASFRFKCPAGTGTIGYVIA
jgi:hypothetical protein